MSSRRMISSDLFEDDFIGSLDYFSRLLWIGLIASVADDQGRMIDNPAVIRSKVFLFDRVNDAEVEKALSRIIAAGKIARYVAGNKALLQIVNWWKYQTPAWASPSKYPAPDKWTDRAKYHSTGNKIITLNWDKIGGYIGGYVAPLHSAIENVNVNGDGEGDVEGECERSSASVKFSGQISPDTHTHTENHFSESAVADKLIIDITGWMAIPPSEENNEYLRDVPTILQRKGDKTRDYLAQFWNAYKSRYPGSTRLAWIGWALTGTIPADTRRQPTPTKKAAQQPKRLDDLDESEAADYYSRLGINH